MQLPNLIDVDVDDHEMRAEKLEAREANMVVI